MSVNYKTAEEKLNAFMDEQLQKGDEMDCDAVAECADMLLMMENDLSFLPVREKVCANVDAICRESLPQPKQLSKTVRIILVAAAITLLLVVSSLAYCQFRYDIFNFNGHSTVITNKIPEKAVGDMTVGYMPDGYVLYNEQKSDTMLSSEYRNNGKILLLNKTSDFDSISFDTEYGSPREIERNGVTYIVSGNDEDWCIVIWFLNGFRYAAEGNLTENELLKVAESIG